MSRGNGTNGRLIVWLGFVDDEGPVVSAYAFYRDAEEYELYDRALRELAEYQGVEPSLVNMHGLQKVKLVLAVPMDGITTSRRIEGSATP